MHFIHFWHSALFEIPVSTDSPPSFLEKPYPVAHLSWEIGLVLSTSQHISSSSSKRRKFAGRLQTEGWIRCRIWRMTKCSGLLQSITLLHAYARTSRAECSPFRCVSDCTWCVPMLLGYCNWPRRLLITKQFASAHYSQCSSADSRRGPHFLPLRLPLLLMSFVFCPFTIFPAFLW